MATTDPRVDAYIDKQADFARPILTWIREQVHAAHPDIGETIKWGMPFFTHNDRPLANMAAFKAHAAFGFWGRNGTENGVERHAMGQFGKLTSLADLPTASDMATLVRDALAPLLAGSAPRRSRAAPKPDVPVPDVLTASLVGDEAAAKTWEAFSPSARREYSEWIAEAKRPETRDKRVAQAIGQLREGKKLNWKYEAR